MPMRDDLAAALARIAVLEAENQELKRRLAGEPAPAAPTRVPGEDPLWYRPLVLGLGRTPAALAYADSHGYDKLRIVDLEDGRRTDIALVAHGRDTATRIGSHILVQAEDLALEAIAWPSREVVARVALPGPLRVPPWEQGGQLWCATDHEVCLIDRWQVTARRAPADGDFTRACEAWEGRVVEGPGGSMEDRFEDGDWYPMQQVLLAGARVVSLVRSDEVHNYSAVALFDPSGLTLRWMREVGLGCLHGVSSVDGMLVAQAELAMQAWTVLDLASGEPWLLVSGQLEQARARRLGPDQHPGPPCSL